LGIRGRRVWMASGNREHGEMEIRTTTTTTTMSAAAGGGSGDDDDDDDDSGREYDSGCDGTTTTTATMTTTAHVIRTLYASTRHTSAHPYLVIILGSDARDGKQLIVIVKRAARISVISYFLSS
jgi:hypothetical protein